MPPDPIATQLAEQGFAIADAAHVHAQLGAWPHWQRHHDALPLDTYLADGGAYRRRRHACYVIDGADVRAQPQRPHWQPVTYNALHGGMERHYEPLAPEWAADPLWRRWLLVLAGHARAIKRQVQCWYVEAHAFRIDTTGGIGRPTPEGAHRDGVDLVAVTLLARHAIKGGETRVFEADGPRGQRFTLTEPWTTLLLDDARMIHETTPIQPLHAGELGWRDTLVVTLRSGGFQGPGH